MTIAMNDSSTMADVYNNMAELYIQLNDPEKGLEFLRRSMTIYKKIGENDLILVHNNLAVAYKRMGVNDSVLPNYRIANRISEQMGEMDSYLTTRGNMAASYIDIDELDSATICARDILRVTKEYPLIKEIIHGHLYLTRIHIKQNNSDSASFYTEKALALSKDNALLKLEVAALKHLHEIRNMQGNYQEAYSLQSEYSAKNDSLQGDKTKAEIAKADAQYDYEKQLAITEKEYQEELKRSELVNRFYFYFAMGFLLIAILLVIIILSRRKLTKRLIAKNERIEEHSHLTSEQNTELENLNEFKNKILAVMGHDLRSPLASLQSTLSIFQELDQKEKEEANEIISDLNNKVVTLIQNTDNLLQWAQLNAGLSKEEFEKKPFKEIVQPAMELLSSVAKEKDISVVLECDTESQSKRVDADPEGIRIILRNLLSNAIKFSPPQSLVSIGCSISENYIKVKVSDQGEGIENELRNSIFKSRLTSRNGTKNEKGTGLGLLLANEFVQRFNGEIGVEDNHPKGTTFWFSLPLIKE